MKERPILFSAPMVRALLAGIKTQTRRVVKFNDRLGRWDADGFYQVQPDTIAKALWNERSIRWNIACPYGQPGDRIWVRETWRSNTDGGFEYKADGGPMQSAFTQIFDDILKRKWKPSIHIPRIASRITLEITDVRVERLNDISAEDALAEGITLHSDHYNKPRDSRYGPVATYQDLWETINSPGSWDKNPWVWVIEFKKVTEL